MSPNALPATPAAEAGAIDTDGIATVNPLFREATAEGVDATETTAPPACDTFTD
jgi:hypothetical protein